MSDKIEMLNTIEDLIFLEADLLDRKQWQDWLDLYTSDCVIWVPSWDSEEQLVEDPELSVNMMYLVGKPALEARVHRITSVDAYASLPLARTMHSVTNIRLVEETSTIFKVVAKWIVLCLDPRRGKIWRGGWYDYSLEKCQKGLHIQAKKITLMEDVIDGTVDIYQL
jgi:3-phenylpropionate/cinnamic acid dioxygenase small subunit